MVRVAASRAIVRNPRRLRNKRGLADTWLIVCFGFCDLLKPGLSSPGTNILTSPVDRCRDLQRTQESLIQQR
jgi:hypothetical protein